MTADYAGNDKVRGESMDDLRETMHRSKGQFNLVLGLLQNGVDLAGRWSADCRNLQGILYLSEERTEEAEERRADQRGGQRALWPLRCVFL